MFYRNKAACKQCFIEIKLHGFTRKMIQKNYYSNINDKMGCATALTLDAWLCTTALTLDAW